MTSWYLFRAQASQLQCFCRFDPSLLSLLYRVDLFLSSNGILIRTDHESCHYASVVTVHVDHVVGFSIFIVFQGVSLAQDVVSLLLVTFWRSVVCFAGVFLYIVLSAV